MAHETGKLVLRNINLTSVINIILQRVDIRYTDGLPLIKMRIINGHD